MYLSMLWYLVCQLFFFFKQKTAYEMRISDWSSDVCSSDLAPCAPVMKVLRPLITQWLPLRWQVVFIIDGSDPAPPSSAGSVIKKAERMRPSTIGFRKRALSSGLPSLPSRYILTSSGAILLRSDGSRVGKECFSKWRSSGG